MPKPTLQEQFGQIDIYLFDRISPGMRILDAGCGSGRNIVYFLREGEGYEVYAADLDPQAIDSVRFLARKLAAALPASNFRVEAVEHMARDDAQFESMLLGSWRVLKPGGLFFSRLGSTIGMESKVERIRGRRYKSPDGAERYLVDEALLGSITERLGGELADPLKTTVVQNQRSMTTWVLRKKPL